MIWPTIQQTLWITYLFLNVPWKVNGSSGWGGYCAPEFAGPRSCSGIERGALAMIRVPSLIPAPLSRPVWGLSSELQICWEVARQETEGGEMQGGAERSKRCADSGFVAKATLQLFPCWKCRARQEIACMLIFRLTLYSNPHPLQLLQSTPQFTSAFSFAKKNSNQYSITLNILKYYI